MMFTLSLSLSPVNDLNNSRIDKQVSSVRGQPEVNLSSKLLV